MTSIPPVKVDIVAGQNTALPELQRTGTEIARVAAGARGGHDPVQKFSRALILGEAREGSLALRAVRGEVVALGEQVLGTSGPLGRLGITLAEFGIGGATGLAAIGGFALIGKEILYLVGMTKELEADLLKLNLAYAQMGGAGASARARMTDIAQQREALREPGFLKQVMFDIIGDPTGGALTTTNTQRILSEEATFRNEAARQEIELEKQRVKAFEDRQQKERAWEKTVGDSQNAVEKLRLGLHPTNAAIADLEHQSRLLAIGLSGLAPEQQQRLILLENERSAIERVNAATKDRQDRDDRRRHDEAAFPTVPTAGDIYNRARLGFGGNVSSAMDTGTPLENTVKGAMERAARRWDPGPSTPKTDNSKLDARRLAGESLALLAALREGSTSGAFTAVGEGMSTLGSVKSLGLTTLGPAGAIVSTLGSAISLFDNSAERRHREQIALLKRIAEKPNPEAVRVQPIYVGANAANAGQVGYEVGRFQDRDGVYRGGGS